MDHADLERAVLTHVRCPEYRAVKPAAMAKALGLRPKEIASLLGKSANNIRATLSQIRKRKTKKGGIK